MEGSGYLRIVSQFKRHTNGKWYLEVDGKPYLYNAIQSWYPPDRDFRTYIQKAAELEYDVFSLWVYWRELEPCQGKYDFAVIDELIRYAEEFHIRLDLIWGGTNFCDHMDPRFTPDWVYNRTDWLIKDIGGNPLAVNGFDMGPCKGADPTKEELFQAEQNILFRLYRYLEQHDKTHRIILLQLENEININGYYAPKESVLAYIDRMAGELKTLSYRIAVRVNIAMWKFDRMDPDIDRLKNIDAQGIDTYNPHVSYTRRMLTDGNATRFRYVAENGAYFNSASHIVAALCSGAFYNIYRLDYDQVWDRPRAYGANWELLPVTLTLKKLNHSLNQLKTMIALASPEDMAEFNTSDGMPDLYYHGTAHLSGHSISFAPRNSNAVGLAVQDNGFVYLLGDGDAVYYFEHQPMQCEQGYQDENGEWRCISTCLPYEENTGCGYITAPAIIISAWPRAACLNL